jgi:hypothetical protein
MADQFRPKSELHDLSWFEMSGVDRPANQTEGWMVMKSANTLNPDKINVNVPMLLDAASEDAEAASIATSHLRNYLSAIDTDTIPSRVAQSINDVLSFIDDEEPQEEDLLAAQFISKTAESQSRFSVGDVLSEISNRLRGNKTVNKNIDLETSDDMEFFVETMNEMMPVFVDTIKNLKSSASSREARNNGYIYALEAFKLAAEDILAGKINGEGSL